MADLALALGLVLVNEMTCPYQKTMWKRKKKLLVLNRWASLQAVVVGERVLRKRHLVELFPLNDPLNDPLNEALNDPLNGTCVFSICVTVYRPFLKDFCFDACDVCVADLCARHPTLCRPKSPNLYSCVSVLLSVHPSDPTVHYHSLCVEVCCVLLQQLPRLWHVSLDARFPVFLA